MGIFDSLKKMFSSEDDSSGEQPLASADERYSPSFYIDTIESERVEKDRFFRTSPYSPIEDRINFQGLNYYPPDPDFRFTLPLIPVEEAEEITFPTSTGDEQLYYKAGAIEFEVDGQPARLAVYRSPHHDELFLPFRDATSGSETYGAGRYLEPQELPNGELLVDFNRAYNPYCAYSDSFSCPLPPFENHLTSVAIRAGEKDYKK